jgi:amidohydrolase
MVDPRVDVILAGHVQPEIPVGDIGVFQSQALASADIFNLTITGKGTHGAHPDMGKDPILAGAYFTTALHSVVSRNVDPVEAAALSIGAFHAGTVSNIIPETVHITGTIRALEADIRSRLHQRLHELAEGVAVTFNVKADINIEEGYPATDNDPKVSGFVFKTAADIFGADRVAYRKPVLGAEDFGYFSRMRPGAMIYIGCGNENVNAPLHSPHFDMDEKALEIAVILFSEAIKRFLRDGL